MLERRSAGILPDKPHTTLRNEAGSLRYEHCLTRAGFEGGYSILYHDSRPHLGSAARPLEQHLVQSGEISPPVRRLWKTDGHSCSGAPHASETPLLLNQDVRIGVLSPDCSDETYHLNADADDVYFVRQGGGTLRSAFGDLEFASGDYVIVPRGVVHRFELKPGVQRWLRIQCLGDVGLPDGMLNAHGQLRMDAPYSHRDFRSPEFTGPVDESLRALRIQRGLRLYESELAGSPFDAVGWDGSVYPTAFSIHRFSARVGQVHLPPNAHGTFQARGALICSFVPRPLDFHPQAIPCPYPHSSVHVDEVLYYCDGNFGSRRGVEAGAVSLHPTGVAHGPHAERYEQSVGQDRTEELAVMIDCTSPLGVATQAARLEQTDYHESF